MTDVTTNSTPISADQRPTISDAELGQRIELVQQLAESFELDAVVVYGDDRATMGAGHVRWLVDYFPHFEPIAVIVAPGHDPIAITGPESGSYIEASSRFRGEIAVTEEFVHPEEEYPFTTIVTLESVLARLISKPAGATRRIGIAGSEIISPLLNASLHQLAEVVAVDKPYGKLRARKSPAELEVIAYAYRIAQEGALAAVRAMASGTVTEREVGAEIEYTLRRWGAEGSGIDTIVASGQKHTFPILHRTKNRLITEDDSVILTIAPRYEGYHGAIGRTILLGDADPRVREARDVALEAQRATAAVLRPGVTAAEIDGTARGIVGAAGYGDFFVYTGIHSIGVIEFEPPILASFDKTVVEEDMVFSIDIPMFHTPWGGLRVEDGFHVSADGAVPLQTLPSILDID